MATKKYINLLQSHEPLMDAGDYEITVQQTLTVRGVADVFTPTIRKFSVFGERFFLEPGSVHSVYPPAGSLGEHSGTFPHIILNRSTLPWERSMDGGRSGIWLALLLFDETEAPKIQTVLLGDYKKSVGFKTTPSGPNDNGPFHETGDGPDEQPVAVIDVKRAVLEKIMPSRADLNFTAHSRRETGNAERGKVQVIGPERAVIIGNRLPKANAMSTVHLVSLEHRFLDGGEFDFSKTNADGSIRLVSLKSWSFMSVDAKFSLYGMLEHLNRVPSTLARPYLNDQVLNLDLLGPVLHDMSAYGFNVTATGGTLATNDGIDNFRLFDETGFLSVEVPDSAIDADRDPQLDPFPEPTTFSIAVELRVTGGTEANSHAIFGKAEVGEKYKPSLWHIPGIRGIEYRVTGDDGVLHSGHIPNLLQDGVFSTFVWVKDGSEFRFYLNGQLTHTAPAPGRIFTKDSNFFVGKADDSTPNFLGQMKRLSIFRRALTLAEVRDIFTSTAGGILPVLNDHLGRGFLPLTHQFRKGKRAVSWYRGPLSVRTQNPGFSLPAVSADQLLVLDQTTGMWDVSYAAAWQLGRLMALEDRQFSLELYKLKRRLSLAQKRAAQPARAHLNMGNTIHADELEETKKRVKEWMRNRHLLTQVPFHYLVPEADMLPPESIRFFHIDPTWVRCLKDGAASIGRTSSADFEMDQMEDVAAEEVPPLSGFLLRSELVAGYPGVQVLGYPQVFGDADNPDEDMALRLARREKLSSDVLLCIFEGDVATVDFFQKPDVLHFGLDSAGDSFAKQLRKANGSNLDDSVPSFELSERHFHDTGLRLVNFSVVADDIQSMLLRSPLVPPSDKAEFADFTSADFAMEMLEGVERVRFAAKI